MSERRKYRKRPESFVTAVQLNLDTEGFVYRKWGGEQRCRKGDWIVDNDGDVYTVTQDTFAKTYKNLKPGVFLKTTPVWAERAEKRGTIRTQEGTTDYAPGDYIVYNNEDETDGYAISREKFESMYERADEAAS
jgi:hypothetical protein